ncbi:unnamed protein product [Adineta steineri]|uniref:G-protein coupled receptors family 1 profile domain-containing protein n=1 Tax=Adineta steineri TaxID=433720 RepID=A0A818W5R7_9BILA|nr:unnamed protein product [Adineta steineri]CAF1279265.1 unnamed protein product [Adineta steineri]CAF3606200.1 unnamed protein product [Adineta steineri]CAF3720157.1 unnamed protein product [Adineta steineri]
MSSGNSTNSTLFPDGLVTPIIIIILDIIGISSCIIGICKTSILILLILIQRRLIKLKDKILFLLSLNMYMSIFVSHLCFLYTFTSMFIGHLYPNKPETNFDTWTCHFIIYLATVAIVSTLYSNTFQALHRFIRIIYYNRPAFYRNIYLYIFGLIIQILLSALQPLLIHLTGHFRYEDYHCQIRLTDWRGMIMGAVIVWLLPVLPTIIIYIYTIHFIRRYSLLFTLQQRSRIKRDVTIIKRLVLLIVFILVFGIPACCTTIVYYIFGYVDWWANHLTWLTFVLSFIGLSILQTCYSPHLRILWVRILNRSIRP